MASFRGISCLFFPPIIFLLVYGPRVRLYNEEFVACTLAIAVEEDHLSIGTCAARTLVKFL